MKKEDYTAKIVNKSKDGITLRVGKAQQTFSWDAFNSGYTISQEDKYKAIMKPEMQERMEKLDEATADVLSTLMILDHTSNPEVKLTHMALLADQVNKVAELLGTDKIKAMEYIRSKRQQMLNSFFKTPKIKKETSEEYKERHRKENLQKPEEQTNYSIGGKNLEVLQNLKNNLK